MNTNKTQEYVYPSKNNLKHDALKDYQRIKKIMKIITVKHFLTSPFLII